MTFRFTYSADGRPTYTATGNPSGWETAQIGFERDPSKLSLVEFFKSTFALYGDNGRIDGARQWFLDTEAANGCDSVITQLIEIDDNDDGNWELFFSSVIAINTIIESYNTKHLIDFTLSQADFWATFVKRWDSKVDLKSVVDMDGNAVAPTPSFTLPLPSQVIPKRLQGSGGAAFVSGLSLIGANTVNYFVFSFEDYPIDEITTLATGYPCQLDVVDPKTKGLYLFKSTEAASPVTFKSGGVLKLAGDFLAAVPDQVTVEWFVAYGKAGSFVEVSLTGPVTAGVLALGHLNFDCISAIIVDVSFNINSGDEVYLYAKVTYPSANRSAEMEVHDSTLDVDSETLFPDSSCDAFLTGDVAANIVKRTVGSDMFNSDHFTSGCGKLLANMLGLHLRGYSIADKPFQLSMQDWWNGVNPIYCLGLGYEKVGGVDKIVCEPADHFFDDSNVSVRFMNVTDIKRSYDTDWQFNQLQFGYDKWESQASSGVGSPSGIDDPQSQRTWNTRFKIIGKPLTQLSKWILASLNIETTRRVGSKKSVNYTYDNEIYGIGLRDLGAGSYTPALDEEFSSIINLLNSNTRYNSSFTPARALKRWSPYWSGCLQDYSAEFVNFASAVGNFLMTSTKTSGCPGDETGDVVAENGNSLVGNIYLFLPTPFEINHYIDWPTYKYLRDHKNWSIEISQTETGFIKFFIKSFSYNKTEGKCTMKVWPKTKFTIQEIESIAMGGEELPGIKYFEIPEFAGEFE